MNNIPEKDKALMWYFNPNEIARIMRTRLYENIDINENLVPNYDQNNLKIGVVIGTYGCPAYIDLALHFLVNVNGIKNVLVHDDCSNKQNELKNICNNYKVDFYSTPKNLWHKACVGSIGDQHCFYQGLLWAKEKGLDILIKFSRRLIPCYKWVDDFKKLVIESDGITFSSYCSKDPFPIRTELIGMNVKAWSNSFVLNHLKWTIENEFPTFAEYWMDYIAKMLDQQNFSNKYDQYKKNHKTGYLHSGYVHWYDILGTSRFTNENRKNNKILWHKFKNPIDYLNISKEVFNDKYSINDFNDVTNI